MRLTWTEILGGNSPSPPNWGLASGRTDGPATSRGDAVGALVQRASIAANALAITSRIETRRRELTPRLQQIFRNHARGGVLVVACIEIRMAGEMEAGLFRYMEDFMGVFARPDHAIGRWRRRPRMESPTRTGRMEYRFFWVTRS